MSLAQVQLQDKYTQPAGRVFISGMQALVRLALLQAERDRAAGLNTAGFITGYRGSPVGGYDMELWRARVLLEQAGVRFQPGVNEDLAATAVWGTQQLGLLPGAKHDGVFAIWYGKGPGVDRSGDPIKHGNRQGVSKQGGVLLVVGDDHSGKSSTVAHQSEQALAAHGVPVLYPATVQEYLDFGLAGFALSRFSGAWVALKCVNETAEATATVDLDPTRWQFTRPEGISLPEAGLHVRITFDPLAEEIRQVRFRFPAVHAFVRANRLDRVVIGAPARRLGVVTAGKSFLDVMEALRLLGIDEARAHQLGVSVYKAGLIWPLEPAGLTAFATGHAELLFVEEKAAFLQPQAESALFNLPAGQRPRIVGKQDESGAPLLPADVPLDAAQIARVIAARLRQLGAADDAVLARLQALEALLVERDGRVVGPLARLPYFCSGCPHNTSTKVPEGSLAMSGIGCHAMVIWMGRHTLAPTQMGGEGLNWTGISPFTATPHIFQNLGDGTYFHSGLLAIRGAVTAGVNITYKILYNDAVAMTGGQPVEGHLSPAQIARQVLAERAVRVALVSVEPSKYAGDASLPREVKVHHRDELLTVEREFRQIPGTTVIIYEQTCAAEARRRRKRHEFPDPPRRVFINEAVCEGCGDCSVQSNCLSVTPVETEFGRKRRIDQSSCNKDYSCLKGHCPSFVTIHGGAPRRRAGATLDPALFEGLPEPALPAITGSYDVLIPGIGGTGVVTVGALLGMAAHIEGRGVSIYDMTGLAQKGGAVFSHVRLTARPGEAVAARIGAGQAHLILGCDLVVAAGRDTLGTVAAGQTAAVVNGALVPTAAFQQQPDVDFQQPAMLSALRRAIGDARCHLFDATSASQRLLGNSIGANMVLVGYAWQLGLLPIGLEAIERAIALNGVQVEFNLQAIRLGRVAAAAPDRLESLLGGQVPAAPKALAELVADWERILTDYQDAAYARRYRTLVDRVAALEHERTPGQQGLTEAVARHYFKLLAYKDEYEVARLYSSETFKRQLADEFEGDYRVSINLAPPLLARVDPKTGLTPKREYGAWVFGLFRVLRGMRRLRGTAFDLFGRSAERKLERQLIVDYERLMDEVTGILDDANHATAVRLAELPDRIRGYGHVKQGTVEAVRKLQIELLGQLRAPAAGARAA